MPILCRKYSGFFHLNFYLFSNSQTRSGLRKSGSDSKTVLWVRKGVLGGGSVAERQLPVKRETSGSPPLAASLQAPTCEGRPAPLLSCLCSEQRYFAAKQPIR